MPNHLAVLTERRNWLTARIAAKETVGWDTVWDTRERDALTWIIQTMTEPGTEPNRNTSGGTPAQ